MVRPLGRGLSSLLIVFAAAAGCDDDDAEASVDVAIGEAPPGLDQTLDRLALEVTALRETDSPARRYESVARYDGGRLAGWTVRVRPEDRADEGRVLYRFRALGLREGDEIVRAQARLVFVPDTRLVLPLRFQAECVDVACSPEQTCRDAVCVDDFVPACSLVSGSTPRFCDAPMDAGPPPRDTAPMDAPAPDAGADGAAAPDAGPDAADAADAGPDAATDTGAADLGAPSDATFTDSEPLDAAADSGAADLGAPSDAAFTDSEPLDAAADSGAADLGAPSDAAADAGPDSGAADAELPCPCPDDGFDCTEERCTDAGACEHAIVAGRCLISGRCYAGGEWQAPDNPCSQCGVASSTDWTQATGQCGSSPTRICCDGLCQPPPCNVCGEPSCLPGP